MGARYSIVSWSAPPDRSAQTLTAWPLRAGSPTPEGRSRVERVGHPPRPADCHRHLDRGHLPPSAWPSPPGLTPVGYETHDDHTGHQGRACNMSPPRAADPSMSYHYSGRCEDGPGLRRPPGERLRWCVTGPLYSDCQAVELELGATLCH